MERLVVRGSSTIAGSGRLTIVFCASGSPTISDGKETSTLAQHDAAIVDGVQVDAASGAAELYIVRFSPII